LDRRCWNFLYEDRYSVLFLSSGSELILLWSRLWGWARKLVEFLGFCGDGRWRLQTLVGDRQGRMAGGFCALLQIHQHLRATGRAVAALERGGCAGVHQVRPCLRSTAPTGETGSDYRKCWRRSWRSCNGRGNTPVLQESSRSVDRLCRRCRHELDCGRRRCEFGIRSLQVQLHGHQPQVSGLVGTSAKMKALDDTGVWNHLGDLVLCNFQSGIINWCWVWGLGFSPQACCERSAIVGNWKE